MFLELIPGQIGRHRYENMRREVASMKIQKYSRRYTSRNAYKSVCSSAVSIQSAMRGLAARNELKFRRRKRAAISIQVKITYLFIIQN